MTNSFVRKSLKIRESIFPSLPEFFFQNEPERKGGILESIIQFVCLHYAVIGWPTMNFSIDIESSNFTFILALKYTLFIFQKIWKHCTLTFSQILAFFFVFLNAIAEVCRTCRIQCRWISINNHPLHCSNWPLGYS